MDGRKVREMNIAEAPAERKKHSGRSAGEVMAEAQKKQKTGIDALTLHVLAMLLMLCDHAWATVIPGQEWLTAAGRLAFPIFAFLLAEGFRRTRSVKRYALRLLALALLSEIPFDLMYGATVFYPFHQNVIWTFLIALLCMRAISAVRKRGKMLLTILICPITAAAGYLAGSLLMTDYGGEGVLTVLLFYLFPDKTWRQKLCQTLGMIGLAYSPLPPFWHRTGSEAFDCDIIMP